MKPFATALLLTLMASGAATASDEARSVITGASVPDIPITLMDVVGAVSKSNLHRLEGCMLIEETRTMREDAPDRPSFGAVAIDLRSAVPDVSVKADEELGVDVVSIKLAKGVMSQVEDAFAPVKEDAEQLANAKAADEGVQAWDILKMGDIKEDIAPTVLEKLVDGTYGEDANKAFFINGSIISPPLPITQIKVMTGKGGDVAAALTALMTGDCAPVG